MRTLLAFSVLCGAIKIVKADSVTGFDLGVGGFVYSAGTYSPVVVPSSQFTTARSVNNSGGIAGYFLDDFGV
jgi:hypothetical protein